MLKCAIPLQQLIDKIRIAKHALGRAREREIAKSEIVRAIEQPDEVVDVKYGRKGNFKHAECNYLVVIYETRNGEIVVVTSIRVDKKRLQRYGFTRI